MAPDNIAQLTEHDSAGDSRDIRKTAIDPNFWFPVALSTEVKKLKAYPVTFAGDPIVLVRGKNDRVFALENRCAHRQIPLHLGQVEENGIKCSYHGWTYDDAGNCTSVPYLDQCKIRPNKVKSYPCREAYGLIFIFPGEDRPAESVPFPEVPSASDSHYKIRYLNRRIDCHYTFMHENLMDMNHQFLHRKLMASVKTIFLGMRQGDNWIEADYTFKRVKGAQPLGEKVMLGKRPEAQAGERDIMTIRTEYPYQSLKFWTAGSEHPALDLWNVYIPTDKAQRCNHTYGLMMIRKPSSLPGLLTLFWPIIVWFTNGIFSEDRWICELEQAAFDAQGEDRNQEIFPAIRGLRKVLIDHGRPLND